MEGLTLTSAIVLSVTSIKNSHWSLPSDWFIKKFRISLTVKDFIQYWLLRIIDSNEVLACKNLLGRKDWGISIWIVLLYKTKIESFTCQIAAKTCYQKGKRSPAPHCNSSQKKSGDIAISRERVEHCFKKLCIPAFLKANFEWQVETKMVMILASGH